MILEKFVRQHTLVIRFGALTGVAVISFEAINLFVLYRHIRLDYYLSLVAVIFLITGILISKQHSVTPVPMEQEQVKDYQLTSKETEVLELIVQGKANKEIAALLFVEISTVKTHINNIYNKLSVTNRKEARLKYAEIAPITS